MFLGLQFAGFLIPFVTSLIILACGLKDMFGGVFSHLCIYSMIIVGGMQEFYPSQSPIPVSEAFAFQ